MEPHMSRKVLLAAGTGFLRAYSGTLYLAREMKALGCSLEVWVVGGDDEAAEYADLDIGVVFTREPKWGGMYRKAFGIYYRLRLICAMLWSRRVIVTENTFLMEAAVAKILCGNRLRFVQYAQELQLAAEYPLLPRIGMIERLGLARYATRVVDVEPNRARVRQAALGLRDIPLVMRNTLPRAGMPRRSPPGTLATLAGVVLPPGVPILIHMGGIGREKPLTRVIDAVESCSARVFFLAFCSGSRDEIDRLAKYATEKLGAGNCAILGPKRRDELLAAAWEADVGVVDYSPSVENTSNQRYCAPTKLYEFMALGLAILGSDNDALREIVETEKIGLCSVGPGTDELGRALCGIVSDPANLCGMKARGPFAFDERHCYEKVCSPVALEIVRLLNE